MRKQNLAISSQLLATNECDTKKKGSWIRRLTWRSGLRRRAGRVVQLADVLFQVKVPAEALPAGGAGEGLLVVVRVHVEGEVVHLVERFAADGALELLLAAVRQLVVLVVSCAQTFQFGSDDGPRCYQLLSFTQKLLFRVKMLMILQIYETTRKHEDTWLFSSSPKSVVLFICYFQICLVCISKCSGIHVNKMTSQKINSIWRMWWNATFLLIFFSLFIWLYYIYNQKWAFVTKRFESHSQ